MIKDIFYSVSQKMQIDFENITSKIQHNGEKGTARENMLVEYLKGYIPEKYCFSKGIIVDCKDVESKQVDVIIHDKFLTPYLVDMDSTKIIPIESVYSVIEVKSTLTKEELRKCVKNIESVRLLKKKTINGFSCPTAGLVFAYDSDASLKTVYKNLIELSKEVQVDNRISCVCILNKGIIMPVDKNGLRSIEIVPNDNTVYVMLDNAENSLLLFYLILTQILNNTVIYPPDMVAYAQSTEMLDASFFIPAEYVPDDATISIMGNKAGIGEIKTIQEYGVKMLSGDLKKDEILECMFGMYLPLLELTHGTLDKVPDSSVLDFFGVSIRNKVLVEIYYLFQRQEEVNAEEKNKLKEFEELVFRIYDAHRNDMIKSKKD